MDQDRPCIRNTLSITPRNRYSWRVSGITLGQIRQDYLPPSDILNDINPMFEALKTLSKAEQDFIILYAELGSMQKVADRYHMCKKSAWDIIQGIRDKVKKIVGEDYRLIIDEEPEFITF